MASKNLYVEIMGRHSNIVLCNEAGTIIDCIKHISPAVNRYRALLPGQTYIWPPEQRKMNPFLATEEDVLRLLDFNGGKLDAQLVKQFSGISPLFAKEVLHQAGIPNRMTVPKIFIELIKTVKSGRYKPAWMRSEQREHFYLFPLEHTGGETKIYGSLSGLLDHFYFGKAERDRVKQISSDIEKRVKNEIEKNKTKIKKLKKTLEEAKNSSIFQLYGELLTANLYKVKKGMKEITVENYYEDNKPVQIPLNPNKTPAENAQRYFTKYRKGKTALSVVDKQIEKAKEENAYLETILQQLETASPKDIEEIREELAEQGYLKNKHNKNTGKKKQTPAIEQYVSSDGTTIFVGKNNKQNDYLTTKLAKKEDVWLHTKDIPGSHVVIRHHEPSEETILEAAELAAYFSKARNSSRVPVDYTKVKYVRKPSGAKPGFVIYDHHRTVYVTPKPERVAGLKK